MITESTITIIPRAQRVKNAISICGTLSKPSKMPCHGYSLPASECISGSLLADIPGSVCYDCYALKGRYNFPNVKNAMLKRLKSITNNDWVNHMTELINNTNDGFFRWHDSGDLQGTWHLKRIIQIANNTPLVLHWLPTREYQMVDEVIRNGIAIPSNLTIRVSAHMVNQPAPKRFKHTSTVSNNGIHLGHRCPAPDNNNQCGSCRACWDKQVENVSYNAH